MPPLHIAAVYVRLSREARASNQSLAGMTRETIAKAEAEGYHVPPELVFTDDGMSGAIRNRPEFQHWLEAGRSGKVDAIFTYHGDRLTREGINVAGPILDVVEGKDATTGAVVNKPVRFMDVKGLDSRNEGVFRLTFAFDAENARAERSRMVERNTDLKRRLRDAAKWTGGHLPYGYKHIFDEKTGEIAGIEIVPEQAELVREAMQRMLNGQTLTAVTKWMNTTDVRPWRAKYWSYQSVRKILTGQGVMGRFSHKGQPLRDKDGMPVQSFKPIITPEEWRRLQDVIPKAGTGRGAGRRRAALLLSGLVFCEACGRKLYSKNAGQTKTRKAWRSYGCKGHDTAWTCPAGASIGADMLDAHVAGQLLDMFGDMPVSRKVSWATESVAMVEIEQNLRDLTSQMVDPGADLVKLGAQIAALHVKRQESTENPPEPKGFRTELTGKTVAETWADGDMAQRRELIGWALVEDRHITVRRAEKRGKKATQERVTIPWRDELLIWAGTSARSHRGDDLRLGERQAPISA